MHDSQRLVSSVANLESFFLVSDDPWVPANDTHDGQSGAGYDWPEGSEDQDGVAQSDDGWYYTPVNSLMRLFAKYNGCASEAWGAEVDLLDIL